jgi:2-methylisocitrate lyase-like PEP mutase family enzyme
MIRRLTASFAGMNASQSSAIHAFRALHESGCFVLPNPWDVGTTLFLQQLGFKALATTSAGFAFSRGLPDGGVPRDEMLAHIREIASTTALPVNADFLGGFATEPEGVAANVALCLETGVAGLSIEDSTGNDEEPLFAQRLAVDRIKAARDSIDASGIPALLTGRCEAFLVNHPDPLSTSLSRLAAYAEAGADCLYAPGVTAPDDIAAIVQAVAPRPVNVLVAGFNAKLSLAQLEDLGVRRVSVGSALATAAWGAFVRAAREIAADGTFAGLTGGAPSADLIAAFASARA